MKPEEKTGAARTCNPRRFILPLFPLTLLFAAANHRYLRPTPEPRLLPLPEKHPADEHGANSTATPPAPSVMEEGLARVRAEYPAPEAHSFMESHLLPLPEKHPAYEHGTNSTATPPAAPVLTVKSRSPMDKMEEGLARARAAIQMAVRTRTYYSHKRETFVPRGPIYRNPYAFHQSHIEMERRFRVWAYREGQVPLFHYGPLAGIYAIEGHVIDELENPASPFAAPAPAEALAFFIPVSITQIIRHLYHSHGDYDRGRLQVVTQDYLRLVAQRYPFWNRTSGADHFFAACHDWGPDISTANPSLYRKFIRVLCNANTSERFVPARDVTLPDIFIFPGKLSPPPFGRPGSRRPFLAFFSGGKHGYIRSLLFRRWKGRDRDVLVYENLPAKLSYAGMMARSRFCLCPSGYEVASPRVVEAIYAGCVPVIISEGYVLPFSDVLDWTKFSVRVAVEQIPAIKRILRRIPQEEYLTLQRRVVDARRHFELHRPAQPFDVMHMIMHSVWLRRLDLNPSPM